MDRQKDTGVEAFLEQLIEHGPNDIAGVFFRAFGPAMRIERERFLDAGHSSSQVSRATKLLDADLDAWRNRPLGEALSHGSLERRGIPIRG